MRKKLDLIQMLVDSAIASSMHFLKVKADVENFIEVLTTNVTNITKLTKVVTENVKKINELTNENEELKADINVLNMILIKGHRASQDLDLPMLKFNDDENDNKPN